jgi:hypothetical protein
MSPRITNRVSSYGSPSWSMLVCQTSSTGTPGRRCSNRLSSGRGIRVLTSSRTRRYSVTFGQLRAARTEHRRAQRHPNGERDPWGRPLEEAVVLVVKSWVYAGTGYTFGPVAELAAASTARAREHDRQASTAA